MSYLYILEIKSHQLQIFFQVFRLSSHFVYDFLFVQKLMSLSLICLFLLLFLFMQRLFCLCSLLDALWCLIFKSLRHFEFILYGVRVCSNFIDLHAAVQVSQHCLKSLSFLHCIFFTPLSKINCP